MKENLRKNLKFLLLDIFRWRQLALRPSIFVLGFFICLLILGGAPKVTASPASDLTDQLHQQMNDLQQQIDAYRVSISQLQKQGKSLKGEVAKLNSKIKAAELEVKRIKLSISDTENEISDKNVVLGQAELKLDRERGIVGEYIRLIDEYDQQDLVELILKNDRLADIFDEVNSLETVQEKVQESMATIQQLKITLENDRTALQDRRDELNQLKVLQELQERSVVAQQTEKNDLLTQTKGQEANYQQMLTRAKADAASIRQQLYLLEGVGVAMTLEQAYQYAKKAGDLTGVRPAFLMAVLKKESSWGGNVGTGTWRTDMKSSDQKAFLQICDELNLDPDKTPVSHRAWYGYGGAIGPAQFLPTTWLAYKNQIANLTGHNPPDPWNIGDAFVAAGIKMAQAGANAKTTDAEWKSAQIYFAGSRWNNPSYYFYGDQIMDLAGVIQEQLDIIGA